MGLARTPSIELSIMWPQDRRWHEDIWGRVSHSQKGMVWLWLLGQGIRPTRWFSSNQSSSYYDWVKYSFQFWIQKWIFDRRYFTKGYEYWVNFFIEPFQKFGYVFKYIICCIQYFSEYLENRIIFQNIVLAFYIKIIFWWK